jgi:chromosome segregation protein
MKQMELNRKEYI